eukprot:11690063-Alexandrium_andersonii.AAC.1
MLNALSEFRIRRNRFDLFCALLGLIGPRCPCRRVPRCSVFVRVREGSGRDRESLGELFRR